MPWAPSYATALELREFVRIDDAADDTVIEAAIASASRAIDYACDPREERSRQFGKTASQVARFYTATLRGYDAPVAGQWVVETDDIADATGMTVQIDDGVNPLVVVIGATPLPRNADQVGRPYTSVGFHGSNYPAPSLLADAIKITAVWGWPAVPVAIHEACLLQASRLLARRDAPFGVAGSIETGSEIRLLAKVDPDVELIVQPYVLKIGAVLA